MGIASVEHFGLLNRWPVRAHEDLFRFNQILGSGTRRLSGCEHKVYLQFERDFIAAGLNQAGMTMAEYLGYFPRPIWTTTEEIPLSLGQ
ncbi:MAG: hypothetical protein K8I30_09550, partial [Anaerolineae bacterium]|nr:hypothetical protein [Anaerolineae bacterium]